jgi:hypothetical protein
MYKIFLVIILAAVGLQSCDKSKGEVGEVDGFVPVYVSNTTAKTIGFSGTVKATVNAGKIVALGSTLFQVEAGTGVHVINMANPSSPVKIGFLDIPGCQEMSIKGNFIYTNNFNDLVVINIASLVNPSVVKRIDNAFPNAFSSYPPERGSYFECADPTKGVVIAWTRTKIKNPQCRR